MSIENNNGEVQTNNQSQDENENLIDESKKQQAVSKDEECMEEDLGKKSGNKKFYTLLSSILILLLMIIFATTYMYKDKVYPGVKVNNKEFSKFDESEVSRALDGIIQDLSKVKISVNTSKEIFNIETSELILRYNKKELQDKIMKHGKDKSLMERFFAIILKKPTQYNFNVDLNTEKLGEFVADIEEKTNIKSVDPKVVIEESISFKEGERGKILDVDNLTKKLKSFSKNYSLSNKNIPIKAKYKDEVSDINIDDLKVVDTKISTYTTRYSPSGGRGINVELAAKFIDDMLLMPGEEFSYGNSVGPVSSSNGYKNALVILNGELKDGIGGGVCQVSSTLYNTTLNAGILPTERRNHSKPVAYVPRGLDATLATGLIDFKFKNTYDYPIVINTKTYGGNLVIELWSNKDATKGVTYEAKSYISGNVANSYLYGYNSNGEKVYEKHIDTSVYR